MGSPRQFYDARPVYGTVRPPPKGRSSLSPGICYLPPPPPGHHPSVVCVSAFLFVFVHLLLPVLRPPDERNAVVLHFIRRTDFASHSVLSVRHAATGGSAPRSSCSVVFHCADHTFLIPRLSKHALAFSMFWPL